MSYLRNFLLSIFLALYALLPVRVEAGSFNAIQAIHEAQKAGVRIVDDTRPTEMSSTLQNTARDFFAAYHLATLKASAITPLLNLLSDDVEISFSGQPGEVLPFAGTFIGHEGVADVLNTIRQTSITESFETREILSITFTVDFSLLPNSPLIPQHNRVAAILQEVRSTNRSRSNNYRLDLVAWLTIKEDGRISKVEFFYDSYIPSQAYAASRHVVVNPDIYPTLAPLRAPNADPTHTLSTVMDFFGRFGADTTPPYDCIFNNITQIMDPNIVFIFSGDPRLFPFADNIIQKGIPAAVGNFCSQELLSHPRNFEIKEIAVGADRVIANTFEQRTVVANNRGYDIWTQILLTARNNLITSIKGQFDSVITAIAFYNTNPFHRQGWWNRPWHDFTDYD